jgi:pimeloyl-ACP methyl ester carboxylesterase
MNGTGGPLPSKRSQASPAVKRPALTHFAVYALDTPGYGFSDKPRKGFRYSLLDDARLADYFIREIARLKDFTLVTHDKGDSVGLALLPIYQSYSVKPYRIVRHVITNGNIWLPLARLSSMQKALLSPIAGPVLSRLLSPAFLAMGLARATYSPALGNEETAALASIFGYQDGTRVEHDIISYLDERKANEAAWLEALRRSDIPTTVAWGAKDRIAPTAVADFVWSTCLKARAVPATYWQVAEANHSLQHDQPRVLAAIIRRSIGAIPDPGDIPGARLVDSVTP